MDLLPISVLTDSYKAGHYAQYPPCKKMVAYGEFRRSFDGDPTDTRFVFFGIRYIVEKYLNRKWTVADVEAADKFYKTHNLGHTPYPYPKDLFLKFIRENDGYFPIKLEALPEGTVANVHVPVYQITAEGEYAPLCTFFETILTHVWYPTTVATLSRRCKEIIQQAFDISVEKEMHFLVNSRLHDFGFRGCTSLEQSGILSE
jgi:nicotinic acid phosphoribosyltransferase